MPVQTGSADITGAEGVMALPQLSTTAGAVGATASAKQATTDTPLAGILIVGGAMV